MKKSGVFQVISRRWRISWVVVHSIDAGIKKQTYIYIYIYMYIGKGSKIAIARLWKTLGPTSQRDVPLGAQ